MLLTEKQAREKWCPQARCSGITDEGLTPAHNRVVQTFDGPGDVLFEKSPAGARCIASDCMAWRWADGNQEPPWSDAEGFTSARFGFCGLAGKPA